MADINSLKRALIKADQAGNTEDAKALAKAIRQMETNDPNGLSGMLPNIPVGRSAQDEFDDLPFYAKPVVAAGDLIDAGTDYATGGLLNKAGAYIRSAVSGQNYNDVLADFRQQTEDAKERSGFAGVGASLIAGAPAIKVLSKLGGAVASRLPAFIAQSRALPYVGVAAEGAAFGAAENYGRDENDLLGNVLLGAGLGVGGKTAADVLMAGGSKAVEIFRNVVQNKSVRQTPQQMADTGIVDLLRRRGINSDTELAKALNDIGPDAVIADVLGPEGGRLARALSNINAEGAGSAAETFKNFTAARTGGQNSRVVDVLSNVSGVSAKDNVQSIVEEIDNVMRPRISAAYKAAMANGDDIPLELFSEVLQTPAGKEAFKQAAVNLQNAKEPINTLSLVDEAKKVLGDDASNSYTKGRKNEGNIYARLARTLAGQADALLTDTRYQDARKLAQNKFKLVQGVEAGSNLAKRRLDGATLDEADRFDPLAVRTGYASQLIDDLSAGRGGVNDLAVFRGGRGKEALRKYFGNNADEIEKALKAEDVYKRFDNAVQGNSSTAQQTADLISALGLGASGYYVTGDPLSGGIGGFALGYGRRALSNRARNLIDKMASDRKKAYAPLIAKNLLARTRPNAGVPLLTYNSPAINDARNAARRALVLYGLEAVE